jgi:hypothetical protein
MDEVLNELRAQKERFIELAEKADKKFDFKVRRTAIDIISTKGSKMIKERVTPNPYLWPLFILGTSVFAGIVEGIYNISGVSSAADKVFNHEDLKGMVENASELISQIDIEDLYIFLQSYLAQGNFFDYNYWVEHVSTGKGLTRETTSPPSPEKQVGKADLVEVIYKAKKSDKPPDKKAES